MSQLSIDVELYRSAFHLKMQCTIPKQGVTALLGPSGGGKTTLLRIIAGLAKPNIGTVMSDSHIWYDSARRINRSPQQRRVGLLFQDYALFEHMTVAQNVGYGVSKSARQGLVNHWLKRMELDEFARRYPAELSGGQRQRVALARALAHEPDVLLLDEPFSAADPALRNYLRQQLKEVVQSVNVPVVIVTHDLDDIRFLADYVGVVVKGELYEFGTLNQVLNNPRTRQSAQALGWQNFLAIEPGNRNDIYASWGHLRFEKALSPDISWLSIRPEHIRLSRADVNTIGLDVSIKDSIVNGAFRILYCQLRNGDCLVVHRPWDEPVPAVGETAKVYFPEEYVRGLVDHGAGHSGKGNAPSVENASKRSIA
jgi:molybdate transport system ATP-binding protein